MEESLRIADKLIEITCKTKDYIQQSNDFLFVAEVNNISLKSDLNEVTDQFDFFCYSLDLFEDSKF